MKIENNEECFVMLWRKLKRTRRLLYCQTQRFCVRRILQMWLGARLTDNICWKVCHLSHLNGYDLMKRPSLYPLDHREFLRAYVAVSLDIGMLDVNLRALDHAYSIVFPNSTPINKSKKKRIYLESPI